MAETPPDGDSARAGPRKREAVAELTDKLSRATSAVITDYRGLSVKELQQLRATLRPAGVEYVVVKNTLARRAATAAGAGDVAGFLVGPVGLALGYGELAAPARILSDHFRTTRRLPLMGGLVEGRVLDADGVRELASLPPREVLYSQLAGTIQAPVARLAGALASIAGSLAAALESYRERLEAA